MNFFNGKNKNIWLFVGGAVFSAVAGCFVKSDSCKKLCVNTLAKGIKAKADIDHRIAEIKEEAEDIYNEAKMTSGGCSCNSEVEE